MKYTFLGKASCRYSSMLGMYSSRVLQWTLFSALLKYESKIFYVRSWVAFTPDDTEDLLSNLCPSFDMPASIVLLLHNISYINRYGNTSRDMDLRYATPSEPSLQVQY